MANPNLTTRDADWHADAYYQGPGATTLVTLVGGEHALGGISGYDAKETTDENPDRLEAVARLTWAWLQTALDAADPAWTTACQALDGPAGALAWVTAKTA